ncbi:hypothetical protein DYB36_010159 [Aphanomyces astaci]|uniref:DDE-1 domain-containing protein n=1 Tax=Aphanomyces astaci TaxID=112090 RepID=A0A397BMU4_APHAT|nr:hypothetical protein DYB36_010159 [Aphanomyces astaci]
MRPRKRNQNRYKNEERKFFLNKFKATHGVSERQFCRDNKLAFSTWQGWRTNEAKILASKRHGRLATLGGQGLRELIPFKNELLAFMRDRRGTERYVRVFHLMRWVCVSTPLPSSGPMQKQALPQVLDDVWLGYAASFWNKYSEYDKSQILNVDETCVFYDMPPGKTLAEIGMSSKVSDGEKHSDRLTAVLTIRADGKRSLYDVSLCLHCTGVKLPLLFILKGQPGGVIERQELDTYPRGHHYAVQTNAWMDERVWSIYLDEVLAPQVEDASVLLVDNMAFHVSDSSYDKVAETLFSVVEPLPPNSTSRCQPLDVGVMGPLKAMLKTAWLLEEDDRIGDEVFTAQEKRLAMVKRTISVWEKISTQTIVKSFEKAIPSDAYFGGVPGPGSAVVGPGPMRVPWSPGRKDEPMLNAFVTRLSNAQGMLYMGPGDGVALSRSGVRGATLNDSSDAVRVTDDTCLPHDLGASYAPNPATPKVDSIHFE